jgi:large subunit ribosomal protein L17
VKHRKKLNKMSRTSSHRKALLANLALAFFERGKIKTTLLKAKEAQIVVEKLITLAKKNTLHARRLAFARLRNEDIVKKLFDTVAPVFKERNGGCTRVVKLGMRKGDGALIAQLELVEDIVAADTPKPKPEDQAVEAAKPKSKKAAKAKSS